MKFQVFKDGKIDKDFELSAAYLFGADAIPLSASDKIKCKNGAIELIDYRTVPDEVWGVITDAVRVQFMTSVMKNVHLFEDQQVLL